MTILTSTTRIKAFVLSEGEGTLSRENVTVTQSGTAILSGTVLGKITAGAIAVGAVVAAGTGNGTCTKATPAYSAAAQAGSYVATCIEKTTDSGTFSVMRPDGTLDGIATVGTAYTGQVKFTIADGATDFSAGDTFTLPVTVAAGSGKYVPYADNAADGSQVAAGILYNHLDAASGDIKAVAFVRSCEVNGNELTGLDANGTADLKALDVIVRTATGLTGTY